MKPTLETTWAEENHQIWSERQGDSDAVEGEAPAKNNKLSHITKGHPSWAAQNGPVQDCVMESALKKFESLKKVCFHFKRCVTEFEKLNRIGEGTYGIVYRYFLTSDGFSNHKINPN